MTENGAQDLSSIRMELIDDIDEKLDNLRR